MSITKPEMEEILGSIEKARDAVKALSFTNEVINRPEHKEFKARLDAVCMDLQALANDTLEFTELAKFAR